MKSKIKKYVLDHLNDKNHHFELNPNNADSLGISFKELGFILLQLSSELVSNHISQPHEPKRNT